MKDDDGHRDGTGHGDDIVDRLYDVALDPTRYEALVDAWLAALGGSDTGPASRVTADALQDHFDRASVFLDRLAPATPATVPEILDRHAPFAAVALERDMRVAAANFADPPARLRDAAFLSGPAAEEVARAAEVTFRRGGESLHVLPGGMGAEAGIGLVKLRPGPGDVVIAVFSQVRWSARTEGRLRAAFGLSPAEAEVARLLLERRSRTEIARLRGRSTETIKRQISAIFLKTGCRGASDLFLLLMSFIGLSTEAEADGARAGSGALVRYDRPGARPGTSRGAGYVTFGAPGGRPCIYLPGLYCIVDWPRAAERAAQEMDLRVVVPVRAGFGPFEGPQGGDVAADVVAECAALMDRLGIERAPFVTQGNDVVFAFRFAQTHPERTRAILACGGAPLIGGSEQYDAMDKWHRFVIANARYAPKTLPFIVKAGFLLAQRIGKRRFLELVNENAPVDLAMLDEPEILRALDEGSRYALSDEFSAHRIFARSMHSFVLPDWGADVAAIEGQVPVRLVTGDCDPMTPPEALAAIRTRYPWIEMDVFEGCGEFVFFRHWARVLERLEAHL